MSQQRPLMMMNDTTYTKLFVGGLAWKTQRDTMKKYFEQFGEILEAVVITDKATGRSKGYGFVTFKDPEAAFRACQNPSPMIDGRIANCNLASFGGQKKAPPTPQHGVVGRFQPGAPGLMAPPYHHGSSSSSTFFHQSYPQPPLSYSAYGYAGYSQDMMYDMNYYGLYNQQFPLYYTTTGVAATTGTMGHSHNSYPYYTTYPQSSQGHGFGIQYHEMVQHKPILTQHNVNGSSSGILSLPIPTMTVTSTRTEVHTTEGEPSNGEDLTTSVETPHIFKSTSPRTKPTELAPEQKS